MAQKKNIREMYEEQLQSLIPGTDSQDSNYSQEEQTELIADCASKKETRANAATLARLKLKEKRELKKVEKQIIDPSYGLTELQKEKLIARQEMSRQNIAEIEALEEAPEAQAFLAGGVSDISPYVGATKKDVVQLLKSLNINVSVNLSKSDTYNLLGCLLTCNETQLQALMSNSKVPVAIKTVIKRLLDDEKLGNIETIEKLWDRIFGKAGTATLDLPQVAQTANGIIPNTVVSRQAYMIIRDTIIGTDN